MFFEQKVISCQDSAPDRIVEAVMPDVGEQRLRRRLFRRSEAVLQAVVSGILFQQFKVLKSIIWIINFFFMTNHHHKSVKFCLFYNYLAMLLATSHGFKTW